MLVGESHYVGTSYSLDEYNSTKENKWTEEEMINMYADCYNTPTKDIENAMIYREWFTTRNVIKNFQCHYRSRAHTMFSNPAKVIMKIFGDKCPTDTAAFSFISFCNYFQKPSLKAGKSIELNECEEKITAEIFEELIEIIKPKGIIFLSKKAYNSYKNFENKDDSICIYYVNHPTSPSWYKDNGKEKFIKIMEKFFSENILLEQIEDERIWLIKIIFNNLKNGIRDMGYSFKICPDEFIDDFYINQKNISKLPYIEISNGDNKVKIEIDHRIYIWKNKKDWVYMPNNSKNIDDTVPNFIRVNKAYRDLFEEENRQKFIEKSIYIINQILG